MTSLGLKSVLEFCSTLKVDFRRENSKIVLTSIIVLTSKIVNNMKRFNSLADCPSCKLVEIQRIGKSMPNIQHFLSGEDSTRLTASGPEDAASGLKHQSSKKVKILQKTWDKMLTIINPSARRNSRTKQSPSAELAESPRTYSPLTKMLKSSQSSSTPPSTPSKRLVFDFEPIVSPPQPTKSSHHYPDEPSRKNGRPPRDQPFDRTALRDAPNFERRTPRDENAYYQCPDPGDGEVDQVVRNYVELQKRLSDELHHVIKDDKRKEECLSEDFKKRLQQWEMWKASTGKFHYTEEELQKLIPLEFSKKLQEWEHIKSRPRQIDQAGNISAEGLSSSASSTAPTAKSEQRRKKKKNEDSHRQKELAWLEKQLEKIEAEKKRLEREMVKYCEREERLQKMREALRNNPNPKQEVWIKTPTAECKVEGINEKFTKKLYKWEEKKGIQPECSTMALLNPKYFASSPEPDLHQSPEIETVTTLPLLQDPEPVEPDQERVSKDYSSQSEVSEVEYDEYEEATDSFATKDEPASGASNTDSDCFNLKPGFRRRSSDAISTPLSSARSPSPSCCTSDDEENFMLQTVAENEEEKLIDDKPIAQIVKAKPIVVEEEDVDDSGGVIVKTQRTIFKPVEDNDDPSQGNSLMSGADSSTLMSPKLVRSFCSNISCSPEIAKFSGASTSPPKKLGSFVEKIEPPRIIGAIRKSSVTSLSGASATTFPLPPIPAPVDKVPKIKDGSKPMLGKIPVWCSPLMARRRFIDAQTAPTVAEVSSWENEVKRVPDEFSLDNFLETNSIPIPPPRPSRIPVNSSPGCTRKKYTLSSGILRDEEVGGVSLLSLTRSNSFQNTGNKRVPGGELQLPVRNNDREQLTHENKVQSSTEIDPFPAPVPTAVTKSKSTGSILGSGSSRGLLGIASKFVHKSQDGKQKKKK